MAEQDNDLRELVAEVAAAYFSNAHINPSEIPNVIQQIAQSLGAVGRGSEPGDPELAVPATDRPSGDTRKTAAQVRKSITPDALISFEDNRPYKTLKRHLSTRGLTVDQYREKHGLPRDYPSVAPNYSAARSAMAKQIGLGAKGRGAGVAKAAVKPAAAKRARKSGGNPVGNN